jgi:hypothetical protein
MQDKIGTNISPQSSDVKNVWKFHYVICFQEMLNQEQRQHYMLKIFLRVVRAHISESAFIPTSNSSRGYSR